MFRLYLIFFKKIEPGIKEEGNNDYSMERRVVWIENMEIKKVRKR